MSNSVTIKEVVKRYGSFTALNKVSLDIREGEFFTLLGPSGCGKTTLLRMIAGFNSIEGGEIYFGSQCINDIPAHKRDTGMVFQNYAIFPHLSVKDNVAYGLKARKVPSQEIDQRVMEALKLVQIEPMANRMPNALSGGQQQRVALARAFVIEPGVLLMDEPLSNLDAKLRVQMRSAIKKLQQKLGITTIYVTHDQEEALAISDRIAVMKAGHIMQVGTPDEIYRHPENRFVANFIGTSNFVDCVVEQDGTVSVGALRGLHVPLKTDKKGPAALSVRPEQFYFAEKGIPGEVAFSTFLGDFTEYEILTDDGQELQVNSYAKDSDVIHPVGTRVFLDFNQDKAAVYDRETEEIG